MAAVPLGKNDVAWQRFEFSTGTPVASAPPRLNTIAEFEISFPEQNGAVLMAPKELLDRIGPDNLNRVQAVDPNLAILIGRIASKTHSEGSLKPIYLRAGAGF